MRVAFRFHLFGAVLCALVWLVPLSASSAQEALSLEDRLQRLETLVGNIANSLSNGLPLSTDQINFLERLEEYKIYIEKVKSDLSESALDLSGTQISISNNYFNIFAVMVGLAGVLGVLAAYIIQKQVSGRVLKRAKTLVDKEVKEGVKYSFILSLAETYAQLALTWWEHYEVEFQKKLRTGSSDPFLKEVQMARNLSEKGLRICNSDLVKGRIDKGDLNAWSTFVSLKNHWVYNRSAELFCLGVGRYNEADLEVLINEAAECIDLSRNKRMLELERALWYNIQETAAFAFVLHGDEAAKQQGRRLLRSLILGTVPSNFVPIPIEWRRERWGEYFPLDMDASSDGSEKRRDIYQLGECPIPN